MYRSRLASVAIVVGVVAGVTIIACGGSNTTKHPDAKTADAKPIDAPGGTSGLGKLCNGAGSGDPTQCSAADPECLKLNAGTVRGSNFWCDATCGTGPCATGGTPGSASCLQNGSGSSTNFANPPANGDAICQMQQSTGTPACLVPALNGSGTGSNAVAWSCVILCGTFMGSNLGTCPTGLTCDTAANACL